MHFWSLIYCDCGSLIHDFQLNELGPSIIPIVAIKSFCHFVVWLFTLEPTRHTWYWFNTKSCHLKTELGYLNIDIIKNTLIRKKFWTIALCALQTYFEEFSKKLCHANVTWFSFKFVSHVLHKPQCQKLDDIVMGYLIATFEIIGDSIRSIENLMIEIAQS